MFKVFNVVVTPFEQNCRLVVCEKTLKTAVVDPGGDLPKILEFAQEQKLEIEQIWLTHSHFDHCGAVSALKEKTGARFYAHADGSFFRQGVLGACSLYGFNDPDMANCPEPDQFVEGGMSIELGEGKVDVFDTPGHEPGHVCYYAAEDSFLLTGDVIFAGSIGRTDLPGGDHQVLLQSIKDVVLKLPDQTVIMPGHGPDSTLAEERVNNPFITNMV